MAIALGSNLGDRFYNVELALRLLEVPRDILQQQECAGHVLFDEMFASVINTSFMYESAPMYVTEQPKFINCACIV